MTAGVGARGLLDRLRDWVESQQAKADYLRKLEAIEADERAQADRAMADMLTGAAGDRVKGIDARLDEQLDAVYAGSLSLQQYRDAVHQERQEIRRHRQALREGRASVGTRELDAEMDVLDSELEAIRSRLEWIDKRLLDRRQEHWDLPVAGRHARFAYIDRNGAITQQEVVDWRRSGAYLVGFDLDHGTRRLFRTDCIQAWLEPDPE